MAAPGLSPIPTSGQPPEAAAPERTPVFSRGEKMVLAAVIIATLVAGLAISVLTALEGHQYLPLIGQ